MDPIRILIADDHTVVRMGLGGLLATAPDMQLVGEAADGVEAVQMALALQPDVLLLDLVMPRRDGLDVLAELQRAAPAIRVLILTSFADDSQIFAALKAGAAGYLMKDASPGALLQAIRDVSQGEAALHPTVARRLIHEIQHSPTPAPPTPAGLTVHEAKALECLGRGLSNAEIAQSLSVSERSVRSYISSLLSKLHLANRTQAALYARNKKP